MTDLAQGLGLFAAGMAVGALYMSLLWASVRLLSRRGPLFGYLLMAGLRGALVLAALALAVMFETGAVGILIGLAGFVTVRVCAVRTAGGRDRKDA